jgi:hypothetical protein
MAVWLGSTSAEASAATPGALQRWQAECERAGFDCATRVEAIALRLKTSRAARSADTLRLVTDAGEFSFIDSPHHGSHGVQHRYLGRLDRGGYHLLWRRYAYGDRFVLVSDCSGEETVLDALPCPSPSGRHMIVISRGHPASGTRSVTVFSVEPARLTPEYRFEPGHSVLYRFVQWDSEETVRLEISPPGAPASMPSRHETLSRHHGNWQFRPAAAEPAPLRHA